MSRTGALAAHWGVAIIGTLVYCYFLELGWLDWEACFVASGGELRSQPAFDVRFGEPGSAGMYAQAFWNIRPVFILIGVIMGAFPGSIVISLSKVPYLWWFQILAMVFVLAGWCLAALPPAESHSCDWEGVHDVLVLAPGLLIVYTGVLAIISYPIAWMLTRSERRRRG